MGGNAFNEGATCASSGIKMEGKPWTPGSDNGGTTGTNHRIYENDE